MPVGAVQGSHPKLALHDLTGEIPGLNTSGLRAEMGGPTISAGV
jgi:hypothetical protein